MINKQREPSTKTQEIPPAVKARPLTLKVKFIYKDQIHGLKSIDRQENKYSGRRLRLNRTEQIKHEDTRDPRKDPIRQPYSG